MHMGAARPGHKPQDALLGPICRRAMSSERGNYLANLALYPGRRWGPVLGSIVRGAEQQVLVP